MYRIIQAEREAQEAAKERSGAGSEPPPPEEKAAAADQEKVRETIILVPGPVMRRIRGSLTVAKGMLALEDAEGVLWYLPGLDRYIGYIEGLDAGEEAAVEGYAPPRGSSQERYFQPVKLFIDEMEYDLAVPPEGVYLGGGQTTVIREIERRNGGDSAVERFPSGDRKGGVRPLGRDSREDGWYGDEEEDSAVQDRRRPGKRSAPPPAQPVWEHPHRSPWSPPASVLDFKVDSDSFWQDDPVKREQRERDSREIWY
jgi:hypothetical protein